MWKTREIVCETCTMNTHFKCSDNHESKKNHQMQNSFEWICRNPECKPNHQNAQENDLAPSPNRYSIPNKKALSKGSKDLQMKRKTRKGKEDTTVLDDINTKERKSIAKKKGPTNKATFENPLCRQRLSLCGGATGNKRQRKSSDIFKVSLDK